MKTNVACIIFVFIGITGFSQELLFSEVLGDQYFLPKSIGHTKDNFAISKTIFNRNNVFDNLLKTDEKEWRGFKLLNASLNDINYKIVFPKIANKNKDWIWRARFWGHEPQTDLALLEKGFHLVYIDVSGLFGNKSAIKIWDEFYNLVTDKYQLNPKVVLEGMSRGGLIIFNWGNRNADKIACIYADAPVCDFKSWPAGKGIGKGSKKDWDICLKTYGFTEEQAFLYEGNPVNHMENIARYKVPILVVVGNADEVVPVSENTAILKKRLNTLGWDLSVIGKPNIGHHPHSLEDPKIIVDFILKHTIN